MAKKENSLKLRKIYGHQFANREMMDNYRRGWDRIWGKPKKDKKV